jgi:hypothetical protein
MKKSKFSEAQIAFILRRADEGTPVAEVCRKASVSDAGKPTDTDVIEKTFMRSADLFSADCAIET